MTHETITQTQPTAEIVGMTSDQEQTALDLHQQVQKQRLEHSAYVKQNKDILMDQGNPYVFTMELGVNAVADAVSKHGVKKAERAAKKHYRHNQVAYEEQAEIEAAKDGVEINRS